MMRWKWERNVFVRFLLDLSLTSFEKGNKLVANDGIHAIKQCRPLLEVTLRIFVRWLQDEIDR